MRQTMTGKRALLEMLKAEGVVYIFGNPGTSEGPLIDMLGEYPELRYILTLQESVAVGMGEAYARATGTASFVSLHVDNGLANGMNMMLDALRTGTPMVIVSANYDIRKVSEGMTDLAELVRPVTKWAVQLTHPDQIPSTIRRAFNEANTHPKGPVYVGVTSNALEGSAEMNIFPSAKIHDQYRPDLSAISEAASLLIRARNPLMMVGDRVSDDGAVNEAIQLAELLGLPVWQTRGAEVSFPTNHAQFFGTHSLRSAAHRALLEEVDLVLTVGMNTFDDIFYWGDVVLSPATKLIHIDPDPGQVGKSEPTDVGIVSHCGMALEELAQVVRSRLTPELEASIQSRLEGVKKEAVQGRKSFDDSVIDKWESTPMSPARMMSELANVLPSDAMVVDDSISHRGTMRHYFQGEKRGDIVGVRGGSIGGGIGATMGMQCANPDRPVFGVIGDGSAMMTIQGLWTAANDNIPCVFIICNNGMYRVLKTNFNVYQTDILNIDEPAGRNLLYSDFPLPHDIAATAMSMGVHGERIEDPSEIGPAVKRALASGKPALLDIIIDGSL